MLQKNFKKQASVDIDSILNNINALISVNGSADDVSFVMPQTHTISLEELQNNGFGEAQLHEISMGMDNGLQVDVYAKECFNWMQMHEIRLGLMENINTKLYENPLYSASQMHEIRLGLLDHLNAFEYANLMLSTTDMQKARKTLFAEAYQQNPSRFARTIKDEETQATMRISDDCMEAYINIPDTVQEKLTAAAITDILKEHDITFGLINDNIKKLADENIRNREICVARGRAPSNGTSGWYELFFKNSIENSTTIMPDEEIDYTEVNTIDMVQAGSLLAKYHPAHIDIDGTTVTGIPVNGKHGEDLPALTGNGIRKDPDKGEYYATEDGYASYNNVTSSLNVCKVYTIRGDLSYYKSFEYDGTVHITGSVNNMAVIRATGDVIIDGFVQGAHIYAGQNVVIKGGVNSGEHGIIEAGGFVRGKFFENAIIKANGLVEGNYFLNCDIHTDDRLIARSKKSRIIGGNIVAAVGVEAVIIGNYLSNKTLVNIGDTIDIEKRILDLISRKTHVRDEMQQLNNGKEKLQKLLGEENLAGNNLYGKILIAIHTKELEAKELDTETERLRLVQKRALKAYLKVYAQLQSGVILTINSKRKVVDNTINRGILLTGDANRR